ncbi:MAG: ABC transporter permease [Fimbriimonas sp.]
MSATAAPKSKFFENYGALLALLVLLVGGMIWQPQIFLQPEGIRNLFNQNASTGIVAIGMTLVIIAGGIDLSVGALMALTAAIALKVIESSVGRGMSETASVSVAVLAALGAGLALGLVNGVLVTVGRIAPFIATLAGLVGYRSICLAMADGGEVRSLSNNVFPGIGQGGIPIPFVQNSRGIPVQITWGILLFLGIAAVAHFLLTRTRFGRHLIAVGANERAARYSAIATNQVKLYSYGILGFLTAIAALVAGSRMNSVSSSQLGLYAELDAIAAVVIGGTSMNGGKGKVWGTVIGVLILGIINTLLISSGVSTYWQGLVKGAIILLAVLIQRGQTDR